MKIKVYESQVFAKLNRLTFETLSGFINLINENI